MLLPLFALLTISGVLSSPDPHFDTAPPGFHWIPTLQGGFHLVDENEINNFNEDPNAPKYDPYRDMGFRLYTNKNGRVPELIGIDDADALKESSFDSSLESRLMIHGWGDNGVTGGAIRLVMEAYLDKGDYNFFAIDWSKGSDTPNYILARNRSNATGIVMGQFIEFLIRDGGINLDTVRISGFSLGGQVIGYAGKHLKGQLPAIYAIEPAGPLFFEDFDDRITPEDAKYVEVIHTCGKKLGYDKPTGHVDFYPNNGRSQPGCKWDLTGNCAHSRALYLFAESMNSDVGFIGTRCDSRDEMTVDGCVNGDGVKRVLGGDPKKVEVVTKRQVFWLKTNSKSPFALGEAGTE